MTLSELNTFQKYCDNRMNGEAFREALKEQYGSDGYIDALYPKFQENPLRFITSRSERVLFDYIINQIETTGYQG